MELTPLHYNSDYDQCLKGLPVQKFTVDKTFSPADERKVLIELYNSTDGKTSWITKTHWNTSTPHCSWYGITCLNESGYIISINLIRNNLTGKHPRSLWRLRNLLGLCTGSNPKLTGEITDFIFANMTKLIRIEISYCNLRGKLPEYIAKLTKLVKIQLCCQIGEGLTGLIPTDIGNLTELLVLSIGENDFSGTIPKSIGKLSKLYFLDFETLQNLNGTIDMFLSLSSLKGMHLTNAGIHGTLPPDFGKYFPKLMECFLSGNKIKGSIPASIDEMQNLTELRLASNHLSGAIPKAVGQIPTLKVIDLSHNFLTSLEENTTFCGPSLETVLLASNNISMVFTDFVRSLLPLTSSLRILNVSNCGFVGKIPNALLTFKNTIYLDLKDNKLSGPLPSVYDPLPFLVYMDLSNNLLTGPIPSYYALFYALQVLDISGNPKMAAPTIGKKALQNFMTIDLRTFRKSNPESNFSCPDARLTFSNGRLIMDPEYYRFVFCVCDNGYYGFDGNCKKCMTGATCNDVETGFMYPSTMTMTAGHWPAPSFNNVTHLLRCPSSVAALQDHLACNPSAACRCQLTEQSEFPNHPVTKCSEDCICHKGGTGRFCSKCSQHYYKRGTLCYPCEDYKLDWYVFLVILVVTFLILWWAIFYARKRHGVAFIVVFGQVVLLAFLRCFKFIPGWLFETHVIVMLFSLSGQGSTSSGIMKITVFYLQIVDALLSDNDIWPSYVVQAHYYISNVINFHFSGLACQLPKLFTPLGKLVFVLLLPVTFMVCIWVYYSLLYGWYSYRHKHEAVIKLKCSCRELTVVCLNLTYFPVVKNTVSVLAPCSSDGDVHFMTIAPWIECEKSNHTYVGLQIIAGFAAVIYGIGIPVLVFPFLLWRYYLRRETMPREGKVLLDAWLGTIYLPYKKKFQPFFEVVLVSRKLLIASMISVVPVTSSYHTFSICIVLTIAISLSLSLKPYESSWSYFPVENTLDTVVLFVLLHSFVLVRFASLDTVARASLLWIVVIVNLVLAVVLVLAVLVSLARSSKRTEPPAVAPQDGEQEPLANDEQAEPPVEQG